MQSRYDRGELNQAKSIFAKEFRLLRQHLLLPSLALLSEMLDPADGVLMQPTRVYDRSGQELLYSLENAGIERRYLSVDAQKPDHFSPELIRVTVGALDPGFWKGAGFPGLSDNRQKGF